MPLSRKTNWDKSVMHVYPLHVDPTKTASAFLKILYLISPNWNMNSFYMKSSPKKNENIEENSGKMIMILTLILTYMLKL